MEKYNHQKIEKKWQEVWEKTNLYHTSDNDKRPKFYSLVMYPYPSGALHLGHWYNFAGADFYTRFKRMNGFNVLSPMGFDAFGLPAENAAIKNNIHPRKWTYENIDKMVTQLKTMGPAYDWERMVITSDPEYYRWTQWMFLYMYKRGLAYKKKQVANWCPECNNVLANEQVINGKCWRCNSDVVQKEIDQWLLKITDYADKLLDGLEHIDWPERTKEMQRNWIGRSEGAEVRFKVKGERLETKFIDVFTTRPDTLFGATFMVLAPEHPLVTELLKNSKLKTKNSNLISDYVSKSAKKTELQRMEEGKDKTGVFSGLYAVNPVNGKEIPIWISDYVLMSYGHGAIMAVPAHDERDWDFAQKYKLPIKQVLAPVFVDPFNPPKKDAENTTRDGVIVLVKHWKEDKYLLDHSPKFGWKCLFTGGIESGEDPLESAVREIAEETGYTNVKEVRYIPLEHVDQFHAPHKGVNRHANQKNIFIQLGGDDYTEPSKEEKELHQISWKTREEMLNEISLPNHVYIFETELLKGQPWLEDGLLINSDYLNGLNKESAIKKVIEVLAKKKLAKKTVNYRLRDWLISRQRYWGAPIPMVFCKNCGEVPVPESDLPVLLPDDVKFKPTGESPLKSHDEFRNVKCPKCGGPAERETDTMDTFLCSSWYYFRYLDNKNEKEFCAKDKVKKWMPVDMYIGGPEHAVMHLLYSRFFTMALYDGGYSTVKEPFARLRHQGMILGEDNQKMSKSRGNVVDPDKEVQKVGADAVRLFMGFMGPFEQGGSWNPKGVVGCKRFLDKVWYLINGKLSELEPDTVEVKIINKAIKKVGDDIEALKFNTAISTLMVMANELSAMDSVSKKSAEYLLLLLAPFAPHLSEELWEYLGNKESIHIQPWPSYDNKLIVDDIVTIVVQVNGKVRANIEMSKNSVQGVVEKAALADKNVKKFIGSSKPRKIIYVPDKILNIVI